MNRLFQPKEQHAVEEQYADNILFTTMRHAALRLFNQSRDTALNPAELFYQVICTLDTLKSKTVLSARNYCSHDLWDELIDYLMDERETEDKIAIQKNVAAIMATSAIVLIWSNDPTLTSVSSALLLNPEHNEAEYSKDVIRQLRLSFCDADQDSLSSYISDYMQSEDLLSEQINDLLDNLPEDEDDLPPAKDLNIRLADGKITPFIFTVEAMHKAGWFVDSEGQPVKSKDRVIKAFLQRVLGVEEPHISQLRSAAINRNKGTKPHKYIEELVNQLK